MTFFNYLFFPKNCFQLIFYMDAQNQGEVKGHICGRKRNAQSEQRTHDSSDSSASITISSMPGPSSPKRRIAEKTLSWINKLKMGEIIPFSNIPDSVVQEILATFSDDEAWSSEEGSDSEDGEVEAKGGYGSMAEGGPTELCTFACFSSGEFPSGASDQSPLDSPAPSLPSALPELSPGPSAAPQPSLGSGFTWHEERPRVNPVQFTGARSLFKLTEGPLERDYFNLMFNDHFFEYVLRETELFAQELGQNNIAPHARISNWKTITRNEFEKWLGLLFHMGHISINRMEFYWSKSHMYNLEFFGRIMSRDRFFGIMQALHFAPNPQEDELVPTNRLFKIQPLVDFFNNTMREIYSPDKQLSLDEPTVLWRGRLVCPQYIKGKKHKYGIKLYMLTEPNGLVLRFLVHEGAKDRNLGGPGHRDKVVSHLTSDFLGKGHSLFTSNWYNSPSLTKDLLEQGMTNTGTLQAKRKGLPHEVAGTRLRPGELIQRWTNEGICVFKWRDRRDVLFISSEFGPEMVQIRGSRQALTKPNAVLKYNKYMGGIDRLDQLLSNYNCEHKSLKWYKKLGIHIMQIMMVNSYLLHKQFSNGPKSDLWHFRHAIVDELVGGPPEVFRQPRKSVNQRYHLPKYTKKVEGTNRREHKRCKLCQEKGMRREVMFVCEGCDGEPPFCLEPCFKEYHIREKLI